jgi:hypothetical protein
MGQTARLPFRVVAVGVVALVVGVVATLVAAGRRERLVVAAGSAGMVLGVLATPVAVAGPAGSNTAAHSIRSAMAVTPWRLPRAWAEHP